MRFLPLLVAPVFTQSVVPTNLFSNDLYALLTISENEQLLAASSQATFHFLYQKDYKFQSKTIILVFFEWQL